jgi:RNA polymerase sigma-70 factor (ECF subfamily)
MLQHELFTRHWTQAQPTVAAYINSMVPDFQQAEDLLQNVAVVLLRKFPEYDPSRPFVAWALGISRNEILSTRRSFARSFLSFHPDLLEGVAAAYEEMSPQLKARAAALQDCIENVKGHARKVLRLRYQEALAPRDIAGRLGLEPGNVRVILSRVRAALQECVERRLSAEGGPA